MLHVRLWAASVVVAAYVPVSEAVLVPVRVRVLVLVLVLVWMAPLGMWNGLVAQTPEVRTP